MTQLTPAEMDSYARACPCLRYLAFLGALTDWTAPGWVYDRAKRLQEFDTLEDMKMHIQRILTPGGIPGLVLKGQKNATVSIYDRLHRKKARTGQTMLLGRMPCAVEVDLDGKITRYANEPMMRNWYWRAYVMGDMVTEYLYTIPVQIGTETCFLRCGRVLDYKNGTARVFRATLSMASGRIMRSTRR